MRRALLLTIAGLGLLALAVVAFAPAALVASGLSAATGGALTLAEATGSWWNGRGTLVARDGARMPVGWRVDPGALVTGTVRVGLRADDDPAAPRGVVEWRDGRARLTLTAAPVPALAAAVEAIERDARLFVVEASLTALAAPGQVRAELTLGR